MQYKPELDGLRAVAVISVLLFHGGFELFEGGFVGVDVFFVLSGYLITSILLKEISAGSFTFANFYERRIRRLIPPLVPVLLFTGAAATLLLNTIQYSEYINSVLSSVGMFSNWFFLSSVGYFDGPGETTPLLHTWSLSIEEQFYLFFPLLVVLVVRHRPHRFSVFCFLLLVASFLGSVYLISSGQIDEAFYASPARFWELLIGAFLSTIRWGRAPTRLEANILELIGMGLIAIAVFGYSPTTIFPGPAALLPTIGTAMIIAAAGNGSVIAPVLKSKALVWVGLISYALYLWHWPILVFVRIILPDAGLLAISGALILSVFMAELSKRFIEQPARSKRLLRSRKTVYAFGSVFAVVVVSVSFALQAQGLERKRSEVASRIGMLIYGQRAEVLSVLDREKLFYMGELNKNLNGKNTYEELKAKQYTCSYDHGNTISRILSCLESQAAGSVVLVMGDSIGRDTWHALRRAYPEAHLIMLHQSGCPPAEAIHPDKKIPCFPQLAETLEQIDERLNVSGIVLSFRYRPIDWRNVEPTLELAKRMTDNVVMLGVSPVYAQTISRRIRSLSPQETIPTRVNKNDSSMVPWDYDSIATEAHQMASAKGVQFVDVRRFFCDQSSCAIWLDDSFNRPLFWDKEHLTDIGISRYARFLAELPELKSFFATLNAVSAAAD